MTMESLQLCKRKLDNDCRFLNGKVCMLAAGMIFSLLLFLFCVGTKVQAYADSRTQVLLIHNNPCGSCNESEKLYEQFRSSIPQGFTEADFDASVYYAYSQSGNELVERAAAFFELEKREILFPFVIIGDRYLMGSGDVSAGLTDYLMEAREANVTDAMMGETRGTNVTDAMEALLDADAGSETLHILYFHTTNCTDCEKVEEYLSNLPDRITVTKVSSSVTGEDVTADIGQEYSVTVTKVSILENNNASIFMTLADQYQVPESERQVPFLLIGGHYLSGEKQICENTLTLLETGESLGAVYQTGNTDADRTSAAGYDSNSTADSNSITESVNGIDAQQLTLPYLLRTVGTGFLNGFNPCALSLVLLFLSLLANLKKGFLRYGLSFLTGKFIAYVLMGFLAVSAFSLIPFSLFEGMRKVIRIVLILCCLIMAAGNFSDCYFAAKGEYGRIRMQLPAGMRRWNDSMMKKIVSPRAGRFLLAAVFLGSMVIACGEFFCTGQIYLAFLLQQIQETGAQGIPLLILCIYSATLCLPSLGLILMVSGGKSVLRLSQNSLKRMPVIKFCNGVLFLLFILFTLLS